MAKKNHLKTSIEGLDILLNCKENGLTLNNNDNLLIVLRGDRGISKLDLALRMMEGISLSTPEQSTKLSHPRFYTLNKDWKELRGRCSDSIKSRYNIEEVFPEIKTENDDKCKNEQETSYLSSRLVHFNTIIQKIKDIKDKSSCIVIYGFGGLNPNEFNRLPMDKLELLLRQKSQIAILIFDNRLLDYHTNADMIIEMQRSLYPNHNYTYFELRISKSILQPVAHGWHKYKVYNGKFEIYPSVHKVLSDIKPLRPQYAQLFYGEQNYKPEDLAPNNYDPKNLENLLCPKSGKITSVIGASNTFKRYLTAISISKALKKQKKCLVVLFNENKQGFINILNSVDNDALSNINLQFLELPVGCISPAEVINIIQEYIYHFTKNCCDTNVALFMLDLIALDYSFPILVNETLFLPALAAICKNSKNKSHTPNVSLYLLCTKSFSLVNTVISISDNVICTERNVYDDFNKLTIYLEKNSFGVEFNSRVFKYDIDDIHQLNCDNLGNEVGEEISTTKEFWRKAINVKNILKIDNQHLNHKQK